MQANFKRMLAYSSVAHSGYLMVGVVAAGFGDSQGVASAAGIVVLFYLLAYSIMTLGSFAFVALLEKSVGQALQVDDVRGLGRSHPVLAGCMAIVLFSLAGVPPLLGFFGKFGLFSLAIEQNFYWLAVWGVLNSVISVYYYLRPIVLMYMQGEDAPLVEMNKQIMTRFTLFGSAVLIIIMGMFSSPILAALKAAILGRS
jgi:NADH-quinone oxidoreductase subunit N